jgi:hypothetical protein
LQKEEGFEQVLVFVTKNDTRWDGILSMFERFVEFKKVFLSSSDELKALQDHIQDEWPLELSTDFFHKKFYRRLKGYVAVLTPFSVASKSMQSLTHPTASRIPGLISYIREQLAEQSNGLVGVAELSTILREKLDLRCGHYLTTVNNALKAALVDPSQSRFVSSFGVKEAVQGECWEAIIQEAGNFNFAGNEVDDLFGEQPDTTGLCRDAAERLKTL